MANKPFFLPEKEFNLFQDMNTELIDELIGQTVDIYKVEVEETDINVYGESDRKYFKEGFQVNCLILYNEPDTIQDDMANPDLNASIEMYFQRESLKGTGFYPEIGDIVNWNNFYFEINHTSEPQLIQGHQNYKHMILGRAHRISLSSLQIEERPR
tara:strand:- start:607 stop:1074 length:468 start_codon:yes stop_codon:yes gene_type:complete